MLTNDSSFLFWATLYIGLSRRNRGKTWKCKRECRDNCQHYTVTVEQRMDE